MEKSSVFTADSVPKSKLSIRLELSTERYKSLIKDPSVILCGQILKILKIGPLTLEEQDGCSDQRLPTISAILMALN